MCRRTLPTWGITAWADTVEQDDICSVGEMRLTDPLRTAVDLARRIAEDEAVVVIDALARAARLKTTVARDSRRRKRSTRSSTNTGY